MSYISESVWTIEVVRALRTPRGARATAAAAEALRASSCIARTTSLSGSSNTLVRPDLAPKVLAKITMAIRSVLRQATFSLLVLTMVSAVRVKESINTITVVAKPPDQGLAERSFAFLLEHMPEMDRSTVSHHQLHQSESTFDTQISVD